jgi:prepilin-type processing-associated H-X9-DG protein/prepilin-type N-terminal cleavage/methylation domain-containing protein
MRQSRCRPLGFTLIELLVVIGIVGLLVAMLIPAIQASREASRRVHCINNLKQFGIAMQNFESQSRVFPPCMTAELQGPLVSNASGHMQGVMIDLLPFIEQGTIDDLYQHKSMFYAQENALAIAQPLSIAICPSAPDRNLVVEESFKLSHLAGEQLVKEYSFVFGKIDQQFSGTFRGAITDYVIPVKASRKFANAHGYKVKDGFAELAGMFPLPTGKKALANVLPALFGPGVFRIKEQMRANQITDGLSHTFMMAEVAGRPQHWRLGERVTIDEPLACAWANPLGMGCLIKGDGDQIMQQDNAYQVYGFHPAGVNFLFADGHVEHLSTLTEPRIILALLTPDQGEVPDDK